MGSSVELRPLGSMDDYLKVTDAAEFLNRNPTTVKRYIRMGVLRAKKFKGHGKSWRIHKQDLEAFKRMEQDIRLSSRDLWEVLKGIRIRLHAIDRKIDFLMHVNGLDVSTLRDVDDKTLIKLYDEVCDFLEIDTDIIPTNQFEQWALVLMQVTEMELDRLIGPCQDYEPWRPFHELCKRLLVSLRRRKGFRVSGRMQEIYRMLDKARKNISQASVIFIERNVKEICPEKRKEIFPISIDSLDRYIEEEIK